MAVERKKLLNYTNYYKGFSGLLSSTAFMKRHNGRPVCKLLWEIQ